MPFIPTVTILTALKALIASITVADDDATKLFDAVELFHTPEMGSAIKRLLITQSRICIIVPSGDDYESIAAGDYVQTTAKLEFDLLIADRVYSTFKNTGAIFGGDSNQGVVPMKDRVLAKIHGHALGLTGVALVPLAGSFATVKDDADPKLKDTPGRETYISTWTTWAGEASASTGSDGF